jgi:hypothetical protein
MQVIEQFTEGKFGDPAVNEDKIIVTDDFIVLLDGVTSKTCPKLGGKAGGRFAVDTVEAVIKAADADINAQVCVWTLSAALKKAYMGHPDYPKDVEPPSYSMLVYSKHRREIWRVGDSHIMLDNKPFMGDKILDEVTYAMRSLMIELALQEGASTEDILKDDVGRAFIQPALNRQHVLSNCDALYGYGVIDGGEIPERFIEVFEVKDVHECILASDGYLKLFPTLAESEKYLFDYLREDPLLYMRHKGAKGLAPGQVSFDDRAYIRFKP